MRTRIWLVLLALLIACPAVAVDLATNVKSVNWDFQIRRSNGSFVNGTSGGRVGVYPADEDTLGKRRNATSLGDGNKTWRYTFASPDSFEVVDVYYRNGCCSDTLASIGLNNRAMPLTRATEGFVASTRAFAVGVVDAAAIATDAVGAPELAATTAVAGSYGSTTRIPSYTVDADGRLTAAANTVPAFTAAEIADGSLIGADFARSGSPTVIDLGVAGGGSQNFNIDQLLIRDGFNVETAVGPSTIQGPLIIDGASNSFSTASGADVSLGAGSDFTMTGTASFATIVTTGDVNLGNGATDQLTAPGDQAFGTSTADLATFAGDVTIGDVLTHNGSGTLGDNAAVDTYQGNAALSWEGKVTAEDSLVVGSDFSMPADSAKSALRVVGPVEFSTAVSKTFVHTGAGIQTFDWDGVQTDDCIVCTGIALSIGFVAGSVAMLVYKQTGKIQIERAATATGNLTVQCLWIKL